MSYKKPLMVCLVALTSTLTGCAGLETLWDKTPAYPLATKERPVKQIIAMWRPSTGTHKGRPTRGFVANILFFNGHDAIPALVNGDVRIYLFDDQGTAEEQAKPIRQYDFPAKVWNTYANMSNLGPAYNIFVPYPRPGKHEANCTLSLRLVPEDGGPAIFSEEATVTLDGVRDPNKSIVRTKVSPEILRVSATDEVIQQSYELKHDKVAPQQHSCGNGQVCRTGETGRRGTDDRVITIRNGQMLEQADYETDSVRSTAPRQADEQLAMQALERLKRRRMEEMKKPRRNPLANSSAQELLEVMTAEDAGEYLPLDEQIEEDEDELAALISRKLRKSSRRVKQANSDIIDVDTSVLHGDRVIEKSSSPQRSAVHRRLTERHPLAEMVEDEPAASLTADGEEEWDEVLPLSE